jgi:hypothetical protein
MVRVNQPLKWDVFSAQGELLLNKGYVVRSDTQLESLLERGMYANASEVEQQKIDVPRVQEFDPFSLWENLRRKATRFGIIDLHKSPVEAFGEFNESVAIVESLVDKSPDAAIFELIQMDISNYVSAHNLQTAFLVALIAKRLNWAPGKIRMLCRAAATMNVAVLDLQTVLSAQKEPMTSEQRDAMRNHGLRGRKLLEQLGVRDLDWLQAVEQHHPEDLPPGEKPSEMAEIIHHADVYLAKITSRAYRAGQSPNVAAKEMLQDKTLNQAISATIIKEIGIYPPGSYVKLANGETAVVTQRGTQAHSPIVFSLSNGSGMPLIEPIQRDTRTQNFAITAIVPMEKVMVTINRAKLFSQQRFARFG